jgi:hypothetical protein
MSTLAYYLTSLGDAQWSVVQLMLPDSKWQPGAPGRPPLDLRRVLDGMFYDHSTGALGVGKDVGVPMAIAGHLQQLYHIAETMRGSKTPNQNTVQVYEQWAEVKNRRT